MRCYFDEENTCDWSMQLSTPIIFENEVEEVVVTSKVSETSAQEAVETSPSVVPEISETSSQTVVETSPSVLEEINVAGQSLRRARRRPAWMMDYKVTGIDINEDVSHFALFCRLRSHNF